ncbi:MAG: hypothetical protein AUJ71_01370 [Candidatus Omnitrophica bacterium CG1_02_49_16]|nr:MAG: hypothetical protein AUJ71_01370 [Candidatus Omnitrophica bacterium CG1_02_49_16]
MGNAQFLFQKAERGGFKLNLVPALKQCGQIISSTLIRKFIETGNLKKAACMLGRSVCAYGTVMHGRGRGHRIGFPTANLNLHHETLPPSGVYAAWGVCGRKKMKGIVHIGFKPTFNDKQKSIEVHFFNFRKDLYNRDVELYFVKRLRSIKKFKDSAALIRAIKNDSRKALNIL